RSEEQQANGRAEPARRRRCSERTAQPMATAVVSSWCLSQITKPTAKTGRGLGFNLLRNQFLANRALADDIDRPIAGRHQLLFAVDSKVVVERHCEVFDCKRVVFGFGGGRVRRAVDEAAF